MRLLALAVASCTLFAPASAAEPAPPMERLGIEDEVSAEKLTGEGIRIAVMSEAVDTTHPHLSDGRITNWRIPISERGIPAIPAAVMPSLFDEEWHGTHVSGILAARCDTGRNRGVACAATIDVHDLGAYGDFDIATFEDVAGLHAEAAFLRRLSAAFDDARRRNTEVANLSFNLEAPYLPATVVGEGGELTAILDGMGRPFDRYFDDFRELLSGKAIVLEQPGDRAFIARIGAQHNDPQALVYGILAPKSREWRELARSVARFQQDGGIVVISESNNRFEDRSGVLNALPALSPDVDSESWLSVVYVRPDGAGGFQTPLNGCGRMAATFCVSIRADDVLAAAVGEEGDAAMRAESGHSMGTPMLSGLVALILEKRRRSDPEFSASDALAVIKRTARRDFPDYDPLRHGLGVVAAAAALAEEEDKFEH